MQVSNGTCEEQIVERAGKKLFMDAMVQGKNAHEILQDAHVCSHTCTLIHTYAHTTLHSTYTHAHMHTMQADHISMPEVLKLLKYGHQHVLNASGTLCVDITHGNTHTHHHKRA